MRECQSYSRGIEKIAGHDVLEDEDGKLRVGRKSPEHLRECVSGSKERCNVHYCASCKA